MKPNITVYKMLNTKKSFSIMTELLERQVIETIPLLEEELTKEYRQAVEVSKQRSNREMNSLPGKMTPTLTIALCYS